jgi:hypothetical protein
MQLLRSALVAISVVLFSCGTPVATTTVSGDAFDFTMGIDHGVANAHVFVLESPTLTTTTDAAGHFVISNVPVGSDVSLVMEHPDFILIQTATIEVPAGGLSRVTFQAVMPNVRDALAASLSVTIDDTRCQMVTTVTRIGRSVYDPGAHGEAGVTVTIDPPLPATSGPVYFNSSVFPDASLTETSDDGGVLFTNVPVGTYTWTATKAGATFAQVRMDCRAGVLVNASPPWGLQRLE